MSVGVFVVTPTVVAPALNPHRQGHHHGFPFFVYNNCLWRDKWFHGLVSGGTTSKQVGEWEDAKPVGYGSMLGEGLLALLATVAVATGFDSLEHGTVITPHGEQQMV